MTREEEIRNASIKYTLKNKPKFICGDMEDEFYRNSAFEESAEWADNQSRVKCRREVKMILVCNVKSMYRMVSARSSGALSKDGMKCKYFLDK